MRIVDGEALFYDSHRHVCVMRMTAGDLHMRPLEKNPRAFTSVRKAAQIIALVSSCACAQQGPIVIDVADKPSWLVERLERAADFWSLQDVEVLLDEGSGLNIKVVDPTDIDQHFAEWQASSNTMFVSTRLEHPDLRVVDGPTCILAHEIGHVLGMDHVKGQRNLMSATASLPSEGCWWGTEDQLELCRVTGCLDGVDDTGR